MIRTAGSFGSFSKNEQEQRWQRVREFMENKELDGLVVMGSRYGEPLDRYLSNWIPGSIVIFPLKTPPTLLARMIPEMLALRSDTPEKERPWIEDIRPGVQSGAITAVLQEKGLERGRIGVVGNDTLRTDWGGWIPFRIWNRVVSKLPNCTFEDVTAPFGQLVLTKSNEELIQVRQAAQVLELASKEMLKTVRSGATELEVYSAIQRVLSQNGTYAPNLILRSGPDNVSWGQPTWLFGVGAPRKLEPGDIVQAEIFGWCAGLEAQVQMSVAIPPVSSINTQCAQLARQTYEEGLRQLRPGKKFSDVVAAMEAVLDRPGVWHVTPLIHSMNPMVCIGPAGVKIKSLPGVEMYHQLGTSRILGPEVVLEPGMVFELEPNACIERHRVNIGGTVIVTESMAEPLNELPTQMRLSGEADRRK